MRFREVSAFRIRAGRHAAAADVLQDGGSGGQGHARAVAVREQGERLFRPLAGLILHAFRIPLVWEGRRRCRAEVVCMAARSPQGESGFWEDGQEQAPPRGGRL